MTELPSPLSQRLPVAKLPRTGTVVNIDATAEQRAAVAQELGLVSVERLCASLTIAPARGTRYRVAGTVEAAFHQVCTVTLEAFPEAISEPVDVVFSEEDEPTPKDAVEVVRSLSDEDPPEPLDHGAIDLGALVQEHLALALDPFPRKPGTAFVPVTEDDGAADNPFAALAALKTAIKPPSDDQP